MLFYVFAIVVRFVCLFHSFQSFKSPLPLPTSFPFLSDNWLFHHIYAAVRQCHF